KNFDVGFWSKAFFDKSSVNIYISGQTPIVSLSPEYKSTSRRCLMDKENLVNQWLADMSAGQWQLEDGECHLSNSQGEHYSTIQLNSLRLLIMFPLHPAAHPQDTDINSNLLLLNNHPDIIGFASFSLAADDRTVVLSTTLPCEAISLDTLTNFWQRSTDARDALFFAITGKEEL
ncbi:hypothetical protein, partial [Vibrio sp. D421a]